MLANPKGLFAPQTVAQSLSTLPPLETTVMDSFFKNRPTHPSPLIGLSELIEVVQTIPVVRRDGAPISLGGEDIETQFFAPLPIKPKVPVSASELNDLRVMLGNSVSLGGWRTRKVDKMRKVVRDTTEGMCAVVLATGKLSWPVQLPGGRTEVYSIDYGSPLTYDLDEVLTPTAKLSKVYRLLRGMQQKIRMAGIGGKVEFWCGEDVASVFLDMAENYKSTVQNAPINIKLGDGQVMVGSYVIRFMDETYPEPLTGKWVPKLGPKLLMGVATDVPGTVWYCAIDSISAQNAAVPLHIVPVERDDDTGISLIGQAKPLPARPSRATCLCTAVA